MRVGIDRLGDEAGDEGLGRAGALRGCEWTVLGRARRGGAGVRTRSASSSASAEAEAEAEAEADRGDESASIGIHIAIRYEKTSYTALLLRGPPHAADASPPANEDQDHNGDGSSTHLPLLLTRMPASLRATLTSYLAATFDCHVAALALSSAFLVAALEGWFADLRGGKGGAGDGTGKRGAVRDVGVGVQEAMKDVHLTLSFAPPVAPALKTLEVVVPARDVVGFLRVGEEGLRRQGWGGGVGDRDGVAWARKRKRKRADTDADDAQAMAEGMGPFTAALARYLDAHLAMSLGHSGVQVVKIACGAFVLAAEGRVRVVDPRRAGDGDDGEDGGERGEKAVRNFMARLVERAAGRVGDELEEN